MIRAAMLPLMVILCTPAVANVPRETALKIIIAEAANQGEEGMTAVGEIIRRRGTVSPSVFCALKRKNLDAFISAQGQRIQEQAEKAWERSKASNVTRGATHYENVKQYGEPSWARRMIHTVTIKDHKFYREAH